MKKIFYYIIGAAALLAAASCSKNAEFVDTPEPGEQALTLNFTTGSLQTRTVAGVDNENLVKRIDYFFFPYGTDGTVDPSAEYVYKGTVIPESGHELDITYRETISPGILNQIFPDGNTKAVVMAIANYVGKFGPTATDPETTIPDDAKTWEDLHALEVGPTFFKDGGPGFQLRWPRRMNPDEEDIFFVMAADSVEVELSTAGQYAIDAEVPLKRLASKVTVSFTFEECIDDKGIKWVPQYQEDQEGADEARVFLSNGIEHTTIGGPLTRDLVADSWATATQPLGDGTRDIFEYAYDFLLDIPTVDGKKAAHYYTYPISMEEGDDNQPYLKLVLPWYGYINRAAEGETPVWVMAKQKEVYYKIVLPHATICDPNMIYQFDVTVNIVGNEKEVQITGEEYTIKDWSSDQVIDNNVGLGRYISLDIPKDTYDMYGSEVQILYVSSGEVEISKLQISSMVRSGSGQTAVLSKDWYVNDDPNTPVTYDANGNPIHNYVKSATNTFDAGDPRVALQNWVRIEGTMLVVDHTLNTNINDNSVNIAPFVFVVTLHLKGVNGTQFDRTVTITQYPPVYVETRPTTNRSTVFLNNQVHTNNAVLVYNNRAVGSAGRSLGTIGEANLSTSTHKIVVNVTTLANLNTESYTSTSIANPIVGVPVIGDPRIALEDALPVNPLVDSQKWLEQDLGDSGNNYIEAYQYADPTKQNVIAPKILIASGYGSCSNNDEKVDWIHNVERCAAYQEDGYPAGRWRLPTEAEMLFVSTLARERNLIPDPFYTSSRYWSNTGRYYYQSAFHDDNGNRSSRCVYDLWYWGDQQYGNDGNPLPEGSTAVATQWLGFKTSK